MKKLSVMLFVFLIGICESLFAEPAQNVSIIQLIATPEKFQNKRVQMTVFLHVEFEGDAVYLHQEDYEKALTQNALWIDLSGNFSAKAKKINDSYVIVSGVFDSNDNGHMGMFSGALTKIDRLDIWSSQRTAAHAQ